MLALFSFLRAKGSKAALLLLASLMAFTLPAGAEFQPTGERIIASHTRDDIVILPSVEQLDSLTDAQLAALVSAFDGEKKDFLLSDRALASQRVTRTGQQRLRERRTRFVRATLIRVQERSLNNPFNVVDPVNNAFVDGQVQQVAADQVGQNNNVGGGGGGVGLAACVGQTVQGAISPTAPASLRFVNVDIDTTTLDCNAFGGQSQDGLALIFQYFSAQVIGGVPIPPAVSVFADATVPDWVFFNPPRGFSVSPLNAPHTQDVVLLAPANNTQVRINLTITPNGTEFSVTINSAQRIN